MIPVGVEKRVAAIVGPGSGKTVPMVSEKTLEAYYKYLAENLSFPFDVTFAEETGPCEDTEYSAKITGLVDFGECDESIGIFCEGKEGDEDVEVRLVDVFLKDKNSKNHRLIRDHGWWFSNHK